MIIFGLSLLASLISVVNPLGAVPVFLSLTPSYSSHERNRTALATSFYFAIILASFFLLGSYIISFFGISISAMRIAGGLVIISSGYSLLQGKFAQGRAMSHKVRQEALEKEDISFAPMAMPMLSGPGSISLLIGYFDEYDTINERLIILVVIALCASIVYLILRSSPILFKFLGEAGLKAISRIMGFLVMSIGIEYVISGIVTLVGTLSK
jgi:multiple antibiotic resistance protein